jgi:acyl-CoA synthetase (AMP-forming)/AMP-acid ligase II
MELSGSPEIPYQRGMCYIHSESNTNLVTCISDSLMKLWSVACEPEYGKEVALDVIRINNPSMIEMTTSHIIQMCKDYLSNVKKGIKYKFPNLIATFAVGEPTSKGEEKLINKVLRLSRAGSEVRIKGITIPFAPLSIGGGDCEHGGIFYNVFNIIKTKKNNPITKSKDNDGMAPVVFGNITALKKNSNGEFEECDYNEYGVIVANSATNMVGYKDNKEKTLNKIIRDNIGRDWLSCDVYGYIDKAGNIHQKDRIGNEIYLRDGRIVLPSQISSIVLADTKNILSCSVTTCSTEDGNKVVINYELSPIKTKSAEKIILSMHERVMNVFGNVLGNDILYREFSEEESFPLNGSGKRDNYAIAQMGLDNTFRIQNNSIINDNNDFVRKM